MQSKPGVEFTREGALLAETFGIDLLAYSCAADGSALSCRLRGDATLDERQEEVLSWLVGLAAQLAAVATDKGLPVALQLDVLGLFDEQAKTSLGNALRLRAGGGIDLAIPDDPVVGPLTLLLRDVFPLMLVPVEQSLGPRPHLTRGIWSSPHRTTFEEAVLRDADLSRLFLEQSHDGGWTSMVYRSTGSGGSLQLWGLPDLLLTNAWWHGRLANDRNRESLAATLTDLAELLRRAVRGEACEVKALVAFTGILLDGVNEIELPFGTLRPLRDHERELAPPSLEGSVSHTTPDGETVTASYAGDVLLETTVSYRLRVEQPTTDMLIQWPPDLSDHERIETNLENLRLAALLIEGDSDSPLTLAPTWRLTFDPLSWGPQQSWSDPRTGPPIAPRPMSTLVADELRSWTQTIHSERRPSVDVAIRRALSASASRVDPLDALVDLVIAWENLFGSRRGELALRISAALAWLLGTNSEEREKIRARASDVYETRSDIVHGQTVAPLKTAEALATARSITLAVFRQLFKHRTELLNLKNGDQRSRTLIMGG